MQWRPRMERMVSCSWRKPKLMRLLLGHCRVQLSGTAASNLLCTGVGMGQGYLHSYNFITAAFSRKVIFFICSANEAEEEWRDMWHGSDFINPRLNSSCLWAGNKKIGFGSFLTMAWSESSATEASEVTPQWNWHKCKSIWANFSNYCSVSKG